MNLTIRYHQQFTLQAESFLNGNLHLERLQPYTDDIDTVYLNEKYFWTLSPFPAIMLMPFVFIFNTLGNFFFQGYLQFFLTLGILILAYKTARLYKFSKTQALWTSFGLMYASTMIGVLLVPMSWYFSHVVSVLLSLASLYEYFTKKRFLLIGILLGCIFATRFTAGFIVFFFVLEIVRATQSNLKIKAKNLALLGIPIIISGLLQMQYNYVRFSDYLDNGYMNTIQHDKVADATRDKYGLFKAENIPMNIYAYFLQMPLKVQESGTYRLVPPFVFTTDAGLSLFVTSPIFILVMLMKKETKLEQNLWVTSLGIFAILLTYAYTGASQFGTRYVLDLLPLWYVLLLLKLQKDGYSYKIVSLIACSALLNLFLFATLNKY